MAVTVEQWRKHHKVGLLGRYSLKPEALQKKAEECTDEDWELKPVQTLQEFLRDFRDMLGKTTVEVSGSPWGLNDIEEKDEPESTLMIKMSATLAGSLMTTLDHFLGEEIHVDPS